MQQRLLKIVAWVIWGIVFGGFLGFMVLRSYASMGLQDVEMDAMMRTVFFRGGVLGGGIGLMLGFAATAKRKKS